MKTFGQIESEINDQASKLLKLKSRHNNLNQIDMLSGEGSQLREEINKTEGILNALGWVQDDTIIAL